MKKTLLIPYLSSNSSPVVAAVWKCCLEDAAALLPLLVSLSARMLNTEDSKAVRLDSGWWIWAFLLDGCVSIQGGLSAAVLLVLLNTSYVDGRHLDLLTGLSLLCD